MGSTWKCLQLPSAGVQPVHGLGEGHYLTNSSRTRRDYNTFRSCGILASRRKALLTPLKNQYKTFFIPGCVSMGWSERFQTHAHESNRSISSENSWEDTTDKRGGAFKDFDGNGDMKLSRSGDSDLFRDEKDWADSERDERDEKDGVIWADSGRDGDSEDSASSDDGYSSPWENDNGSSDNRSSSSSSSSGVGSAADSLAIGGKEPVYQVLEVHPGGDVVQREVSRRQLLRSIAGLRLRDIRSVDPSLWVTNSVPAILVRDQAILLNLGSLRVIATSQSVLIFEHKSVGAEAFMGALLPRLRTANGQGPIMPFELEVVEAALISRTQRLERMLMDVEPRVMASLKVLPIRYTGDVLEELRLGKQALVELAAKAGALRQMLLEMLEHPEDIRKMTIMERTCKVRRQDGSIECTLPLDKQSAEDEEEEIEMLLEYYLQRCDSCHGQAEKLLDAAKEMEDSIGVNLSSRRLEVSRLELLLQVGTFCSALGALVAGIFGMNLKSYLEERAMAFYITTGGIIFGGIALFIVMYRYLRARKIL